MKKSTFASAVGLTLAISALSLSPARATEGYFAHGYGAVNKSMAGAGVATGFGAMWQATNPASLTLVDPQFTVDLSIFSPTREYGATNVVFGTSPVALSDQKSGSNFFLIPSMAGTYDIDDVSNFGWAVFGNGGMNTSYDGPNGPFYGGKTGVDLIQAFVQLTYARAVTSNIAVGISPVLAVQRFKASGLSASFAAASLDPNNLSDNGGNWSYGVGVKIGVQADLGSGFRVGTSYQSRMFMTKLDDYAGLFAEQGDFDIPQSLQVGVSYTPSQPVTIALDYKRIWYSGIASVGNPISNLTVGGQPLGSDNGPGFGWENINIYKLGVQFEATPKVALRAGIAYNDNPVPDSEVMFNILAPGVVQQHYTAGVTWRLNQNHAINFAALFVPSNSVSGPDPFGAGQTITIEMSQWEATSGWSWTF